MTPIEIYTTRFCPYCHAAKRLLSRKGIEFTEIDISGDAKGRRAMVERANGRLTVPKFSSAPLTWAAMMIFPRWIISASLTHYSVTTSLTESDPVSLAALAGLDSGRRGRIEPVGLLRLNEGDLVMRGTL